MARCESLDLMRGKILENKIIKKEPSTDSDSESDIAYMLDLDISGNVKLKRSDSSDSVHIIEEKPVITHPVLSLKCLHDDSEEELSFCKSDEDDSPSSYKSISEVPESSVESLDKDVPHELSSTKSDEADSPISINTNEVPESSVKSFDKLEPQHKNQPVIPETTLVCIPVRLSTAKPAAIPASGNYKGIYNFEVKVDCNSLPKRSESPAYSETRNKLYVCKDFPFKILVTAVNVPSGSIVRAHAIFSRPECVFHDPLRCPTHAQQDFSRGNPAYEHLVQCVSDTAVYEKNTKTGRMSVSVPYEKPQDGQTCTTYLMKLTCFSSCAGGINRRPLTLVFTLEKNNIPLGRQIMEAKVCACPARDFKTDNDKEEKRRLERKRLDSYVLFQDTSENSGSQNDAAEEEKSENRQNPELIDSNECHEPSQSSSSNGTKYSITVKDRELFEFLKHMKVLYETGVHNVLTDT